MAAMPNKHRITEPNPFETVGSEEYLPPGLPHVVELACRDEWPEEESDYGCVDWYQYARHQAPPHRDAPPK